MNRQDKRFKRFLDTLTQCTAGVSVKDQVAAHVDQAAGLFCNERLPAVLMKAITGSSKQADYVEMRLDYKKHFRDLVLVHVDQGMEMLLTLLFVIARQEALNRLASREGLSVPMEVLSNSKPRLKTVKGLAHFFIDQYIEMLGVGYRRQGQRPTSEDRIKGVEKFLSDLERSEEELDPEAVKIRIQKKYGKAVKVESVKKTLRRHKLSRKTRGKRSNGQK
ncbi:MAG: hypothetical protein L0226_15940 [Acidobacteria bacterium]|nr:hypothetical protein [Acidobacteriota bacterium]